MRPLNVGGVGQKQDTVQWPALRHCGWSIACVNVHDESVNTFGYGAVTTKGAGQSKGVLWSQRRAVFIPITMKKQLMVDWRISSALIIMKWTYSQRKLLVHLVILSQHQSAHSPGAGIWH